MAMTQEKFDALVNKLERYAQKNPGLYRFRVALLAGLGYAYLAAVILLMLGGLALLITFCIQSRRISSGMIKLLICLIGVVCIILKSLWVTIPKPEGIVLSRNQTPELFKMLDEITNSLKATRADCVLLTDDFNAAVSQVPRLGILGWHRNYLILGLPLMQSLSPEQFRAVVAHEFGHLSGNHSQFSGRVYHLRRSWCNVIEQLDGNFMGIMSFFNWYVPFFNAYSFVLARKDEYEADRCARELAGASATAAALVNIEVKAPLHQRFWQQTFKKAGHEPEPPAHCFTELSHAMRAELDVEQKETWLTQALNRKTDTADTHPCLRDRLSPLGYNPDDAAALVVPLQQTAAEFYLGAATTELTRTLNQNWLTSINFQWNEHYTQISEKRQQLEDYAQREQQGENLNEDECWTRATLAAEVYETCAAIPLVATVLKQQPKHPGANYLLGSLMLSEANAKGLQYLNRSIALSPDYVLAACKEAYSFLCSQGQEEKASQYRDKYEAHAELLNQAEAERAQLSVNDTFEPHSLDTETLQTLRQQLSAYELKTAYLVKKQLKFFPEKEMYILMVQRANKLMDRDRDEKTQEMIQAIADEVNIGIDFLILNENGSRPDLYKKIRNLGGEPILG